MGGEVVPRLVVTAVLLAPVFDVFLGSTLITGLLLASLRSTTLSLKVRDAVIRPVSSLIDALPNIII